MDYHFLKNKINNYNYVCLIHGHGIPYLYGGFESKLAWANTPIDFDFTKPLLSQLNKIINKEVYGYITYDIKNEIEFLQSNNLDLIGLPNLNFFEPEGTVSFEKLAIDTINLKKSKDLNLKCRYSREEYLQTVKKLQAHIQRGDIYEINFCIEFYIENVEIDVVTLFLRLQEISPMPFASLFKEKDVFQIGASPERFLKKVGNKLISQPIKGTAKRLSDPEQDELLKLKLRTSAKEIAENIMIVDLVRNDLSKIASNATVKVEELCKLYSFEKVHQLISTVVCKTDDDVSLETILNATFPMGSMTGAPKVRAMQLIEQYEKTKRGLFSGTIGYVKPNGDFDFNVVIRSIIYHSDKKYLSFHVGSAITIDADPAQEWQECLTKISPILQALDIDFS